MNLRQSIMLRVALGTLAASMFMGTVGTAAAAPASLAVMLPASAPVERAPAAAIGTTLTPMTEQILADKKVCTKVTQITKKTITIKKGKKTFKKTVFEKTITIKCTTTKGKKGEKGEKGNNGKKGNNGGKP
ncbi:MAG: hypothetical protein NTZ05_13380 [Chloroflexi bacterium]|nr:hypothetical protein [Chloroflexota bacterium]